jgi:hypothetical protein
MKVNITMLKWMVFVFEHLKLRLIHITELSNFINKKINYQYFRKNLEAHFSYI